MAHLFTSSLFLFAFLVYCSSILPSSFSDKISSTFASTQITFWYENVKNEMPAAISTKLSPLTKTDSDYYAQTISQKNFKADTKFCSLAKLACSAPVVIKALPGNRNYQRAATSQEKIDPSYFFRSSSLKEGDTIHLSNLKESLPHRAFLPPQIVSKVSLSLEGVSKLFPGSSKDAIETTISSFCNTAAAKGEFKSCPKSLEEMISFSKATLGASKLLALTSKNTAGSDKLLMIEKVKQFHVETSVACHEIFLPFASYICHSVPSAQIYAVDLIEPKTRTPVNTALAVCHMDTSSWSKDHIAFKILKSEPGQGEACHWMNELDLAWINADGDK